MELEARERQPLSPLQEANPRQEPPNNSKKRKVSQFFSKHAKRSCISDENAPLLQGADSCMEGTPAQDPLKCMAISSAGLVGLASSWAVVEIMLESPYYCRRVVQHHSQD